MKIQNVSCMQFAGIRDCNISFGDGVNIVCGKNESGKSTLVNLISRTLFQNARVDGRKDKEFRQAYFPSERKGAAFVGDSIDGRVVFSTPNGKYTLSKEWGTESRCVLSAPEGVIRDQATIDAVLRDALGYGEGVYTDMLLSSQKNSDISLQTILDATKKTDAKQEIVDRVSQAFAESDGVSADLIERAIDAKIEEISGKHWDFEREIPVKKAGRWASGLGEVLKAYYELEDARIKADEISRLEECLENAVKNYNISMNEVQKAQREFNDFNAYAATLEILNERRKNAERLKKELTKISVVLENRPKITADLERAKTLQTEMTNRELLDKYNAANMLVQELEKVDKKLLKSDCPENDEIMKIRDLQRRITGLQNKLCTVDLTAVYKTFGDNEVEIVSLLSGEKLDVTDGKVTIGEAVRITVAGVFEMELSAADVDVKAVENEIEKCRNAIGDIFGKYNLKTIEELEELKDSIRNERLKFDDISNKLSMLLGEMSFDELEKNVQNIPGNMREKDEIASDIFALCKTGNVERFITVKETEINAYENEYGNIAELNVKVHDLKTEFDEVNEVINNAEIIPEEYANISDPSAYLDLLETKVNDMREKCDRATEQKSELVGKLETYKESIDGDPQERVREAQREFNEIHSLLKHWMHVKEVFNEQKVAVAENPMHDIADSFTKYLSLISDNKISSEFTEANKLDMVVYSDDRLLDYGKLSEGTKETVSLAFRLAVLDHLFPNGGGVIVLDDPLTDMDIDRAKQACALIQECAKKHQVIFLTCREEYMGMLNGNCIFI